MIKRHHQILAGILIVQIMLVVIVLLPKGAAVGASEPIFPDLSSQDIVALTVIDAEGQHIRMEKIAGEWVLPDVDNYPVLADKVSPLLEQILGLNGSRLVTRTEASHKRLQVAEDDFVRRIDLETAQGAYHTIYLGSSPRYGATHFRVHGQKETYLTDELTSWQIDASMGSWIDTSYLNLPKEDITQLTLENANGTFILSQDAEGNWTLAGLGADETLSQSKVNGLVQAARIVRMVEPLGQAEQPDYGMSTPNAVVTLETADATITLRVGAQDPLDSSYVVISSESPFYVRVAEHSVQLLVEKDRAGLLEEPPTPEPTP